MSLTCLPDDILRTIAQHVGLLDACALAQVCSITSGAFNSQKLASSRTCFETMYRQPMALLDRCIRTIQSGLDEMELILDTAFYVDGEGVCRLGEACRLHEVRNNISLLLTELNNKWRTAVDCGIPRTFSRTVNRECIDIMIHFSIVIGFTWEKDRDIYFIGVQPTQSQINDMWKRDYRIYRSKFEKQFERVKIFRAESAHLLLPSLPIDVLAK